ncbi:MAG: hypothetical protein V9E83_10875 [Baekduia sp.]
MPRVTRIHLLAAFVLLALLAASGAGLVALPAALLLLALGFGRYPGEERLFALRGRSATAPRAPRRVGILRAQRSVPARGSALLAFHLAVRPPPPVSP